MKDTLKERVDIAIVKLCDAMYYCEKVVTAEDRVEALENVETAKQSIREIIEQTRKEEQDRIVEMIKNTKFDIGEREWCGKCGINIINKIKSND